MERFLLTSKFTSNRLESLIPGLKNFGINDFRLINAVEVTRYSMEMNNRKVSNYLSHCLIYKTIIEEENIEKALVMEDDLILTKQVDEHYELFDSKILLLGADIIIQGEEKHKPSVFKGTHCYIISKEGAEEFYNHSLGVDLDDQMYNFYIDIALSNFFGPKGEIRIIDEPFAFQNKEFPSSLQIKNANSSS